MSAIEFLLACGLVVESCRLSTRCLNDSGEKGHEVLYIPPLPGPFHGDVGAESRRMSMPTVLTLRLGWCRRRGKKLVRFATVGIRDAVAVEVARVSRGVLVTIAV